MHTTKNAASRTRRLLLRQIALGWLALICLAIGSAGVSAAAAPAPIVLYDGAKSNRPDDQGFTFLAVPSVSPTTAGDATILDTASNKNTFAGYFSKPTPQLVLDRAIGYTVSFTVQVELEDHAGSDKNSDGTEDRAGFSLIVLSSDTRGIELGFWKDRIWAQEDGATEPPLFTQAEGAPFDTQSARVGYVLAVLGDSYALSSNGTPILSGRLRDYTAFNDIPDPYETPNLIFLGDDTSSASAKISLAYVAAGPIASIAPSLDRKVYVPLLMR
ncbi:MAG: PEP-CTERM sorting domain-containing protein [Roseiflexaceae bacterium]